MNREEKNNLLVGSAVILFLTFLSFVVFQTKDKSSINAQYVLISSIPSMKTLHPGDAVFMEGKKVGVVQDVSAGISAAFVAVRMKVSKEAFDAIGEDSIAWIEEADSSDEALVIIKKGTVAKTSRFVKIKSVRGIQPLTNENTK